MRKGSKERMPGLTVSQIGFYSNPRHPEVKSSSKNKQKLSPAPRIDSGHQNSWGDTESTGLPSLSGGRPKKIKLSQHQGIFHGTQQKFNRSPTMASVDYDSELPIPARIQGPKSKKIKLSPMPND
jgi:hypothetical protein